MSSSYLFVDFVMMTVFSGIYMVYFQLGNDIFSSGDYFLNIFI
jgi:hypothetical protein